jgi:hypothetical protein
MGVFFGERKFRPFTQGLDVHELYIQSCAFALCICALASWVSAHVPYTRALGLPPTNGTPQASCNETCSSFAVNARRDRSHDASWK